MIDLIALREQTEQIKALILRKDPDFDVDRLIELEKTTRSLRQEVEFLRKQKKDLSAQAVGGLTENLREQSIEIGKQIKEAEAELETVDHELKQLWLSCPNIPESTVQIGNKEANKVVKTAGKKPTFTFTPKHHLELNEKAAWFDMHAGTRMSGAQFVFYNEIGTKVIYALTHLMLKNNKKHGFNPVYPPALVTEQSLYNSGNLPKFKGDFYEITADKLCPIPTAEVPLTNLHADHIFEAEKLPMRYCAWTSCFRREAGGYGATDRGLIRIHQFEKVELYALTKPEDSNQELNKMLACAEDILQQLGLHYQISLLATQDMSFASAKTFDIEVWLPGQNQFYEVSSASNCKEFQARRAAIRYRKTKESKPELVHTLNASSLALPRLMVALMETYQKEDGTITLPTALQEIMNNLW